MLGRSTPVLPAEDIARAKAFYTDKLGLSVMFESDEGVALNCADGSGIFVYPHARTTATHTAATFMVDDIAAEMSSLRSKGVTFEEYDQPGLKTVDGVAESAGIKAAWFVDTEGNVISIGEFNVS